MRHKKKKETFLPNKILCAIVASMVTVGVVAQAPAQRPKLVVGIVVEGLNEDYLHLLKGYFGEGGFNRLMRNGITIENVQYGPGVDPAAATAILFTGTAPSVNGVAAATVYDREAGKSVSILNDASQIGNFTDETYSPAGILVSTLGDEIRVESAGTGLVHSIAPDPVQAIVMAGHAGNSAFWINDYTGKWSTTTYYKDVPQSIAARNYRGPLSTRLDTLTWTPSMDLKKYPDLPDHKRLYPYRYTFPRKELNRFQIFKKSAPVNREITNIAIDYIPTMSLGKRGMTDMLSLGYTLSPYPYSVDSDNRLETMDAYLRLDADLARLFNAIDKNVGMGNSLIFLAGTPASTGSKRESEKWGIPYGQFSPKKAQSLLNMYLMALHGNGDWVSDYHNRHVYLNHKTIKDAGLDLPTVRAEAADFLGKMSGVSGVYTIDDIIASRAGNDPQALKRNSVLKYTGDLVITINPGWEIVDEESAPTNTVVREYSAPSPVFILAPGVAARRIDTPVDATAVAPTVARLLRIRSPNGAATPALRF